MRTALMSLGIAALILSPAIALADTAEVDVVGWYAEDVLGSPANSTVDLDIGPGSHVTGIAWDVMLAPNDPAWYSNAWVNFASAETPSDQYNVQIAPGWDFWDRAPLPFAGSDDLVAAANDFYVGGDGLLSIEFYAFEDMFPPAYDAYFDWPSTLTIEFTPVPEPSTLALLGMAGLAVIRRR